MAFKAGDIVRVVYAGSPSSEFTKERERFLGKMAKITEADSDGTYKIEGSRLWWQESRFQRIENSPLEILRPGMVVHYHNGLFAMVMTSLCGTFFISPGGDFMRLEDYDPETLNTTKGSSGERSKYAIDQIYDLRGTCSDLLNISSDYRKLLWEYKEPEPKVKEMTVAEIEDALGYKVKVVEG